MRRAFHMGSAVLLALALSLLAVLAPAGVATAQEASPEASSLLEDLGLPVLEVTVTSDGIDAPAEVAAGPVLLVVHNETEGFLISSLSQLPEGVTGEDYRDALLGDALPAWVADATVAGGFDQEPGTRASAVINLAPAVWSLGAAGDDLLDGAATSVTATGEVPDDAESGIPVDAEVSMGDYAFALPDTLVSGPQVWHVTNTAPGKLHHIVLFPAEALYTPEDVHANLMVAFSGTPVADGFDLTTAQPVMATSAISGGQSIWVDVNLEAGPYVALCFISDPGSDVPHVMQGMIATFEVTEGA